jgi:hypothetical protein
MQKRDAARRGLEKRDFEEILCVQADLLDACPSLVENLRRGKMPT